MDKLNPKESENQRQARVDADAQNLRIAWVLASKPDKELMDIITKDPELFKELVLHLQNTNLWYVDILETLNDVINKILNQLETIEGVKHAT